VSRRALAAVVVVVAAAALAGGAGAADEVEGKRRWKAGQELYQQKRYLEAAREFEAGYAAAPRPLFLLNIGHAYRRANELAKAKSAYESLLRLQPDLPQRAEVEGYIKSIDDALKAGAATTPEPPRPATPTSPQAAAPPPPPREVVVTLPTLPPVTGVESPPVAPYVETREEVERERSAESVFKKPWFWVIAGALVAGGVAAAVIASRPSTSCPGTLCIRE
jgi:tetratricopeptide (TPR) repeat protein